MCHTNCRQSFTDLLCLADQTVTRLDALSPFSPAAIIQASLVCRVTGFSQRGIDDGSGDSSAAAAYDRQLWVDAFRLKDGLELGGWEKGLVFRVEEISDRDGDGVGDVSGRETCRSQFAV